MNIPKRLYPHLYEYNKLVNQGNETEYEQYASDHEPEIEIESTEMYKVIRNRRFNLGTDKKIHGIDDAEELQGGE